MEPHLIVALDIDGTLIDLTGAGSRAMNHAFVEVLGIDGPPPSSFAGSTDLAIVSDLFSTSLGGRAPTKSELDSFFECYLRWLAQEIARTPHSPTPGATELIALLEEQPTFVVGLATGNVREAARLKLESAGLGWSFEFGAYGDESSDRVELVALALDRGRACLPTGAPTRAVVVGDTPRDIDAALANDALAIAVATGPFPVTTLLDHEADHVFESLASANESGFWRSITATASPS